MTRALWLIAAALPLAAQPKLLVNAQTDTRSAAAGLDATFRPLVSAQPAWIGYSVAGVRAFLGCDYVRDGWSQPGVIHLEPPDHAVVLFRVEGGEVVRIRTLSPDCEIDAGGLAVHWLTEVNPAESVALLRGFADRRERAGDGALTAIAVHSGAAADAALRHYLDPAQPSVVRVRAVACLGSYRRPDSRELLVQLARADADTQVRRRAVSALAGLPNGEGVPSLIELAKETRDAETRKHAMNLLSTSRDLRAVTFFEELLKK